MRNRLMKAASLVCAMLLALGTMAVAAMAATDDILTVTAEGTTTEVAVSGTTDASVVAVVVEIFDANNALVTMETHAVTDGAYEATLTAELTAGATYTVYVVNYSGAGEAVEEEFTVPEEAEDDDDADDDADDADDDGDDVNDDPQLGDVPFARSIGLMAAMALSMGALITTVQVKRVRK